MKLTKEQQWYLDADKKGDVKLVTDIKPGTLMAYQTWSGYRPGSVQFYIIIDFDPISKCYTISERYSAYDTSKSKFHKIYIYKTDKGNLTDTVVGNFPESKYLTTFVHTDFIRSNLHIATKAEQKAFHAKNLTDYVSRIGMKFWDIVNNVKKTMDLDDYGIIDMTETKELVTGSLDDFLEDFNDVKKELKLDKSIFDTAYVEKYLTRKES